MRKFIRLSLHWQIIIGTLAGVLTGLVHNYIALKVSIIGTLFLKLLKMIVVPLVFTSIVCGISGSGTRTVGRIAIKTFVYYTLTSLLAILTGLTLVNFIKPGISAHLGLKESPSTLVEKTHSIKDFLIRIVPSNPIKALTEGDMLQIIFFSIIVGFFLKSMKEGEIKKTLENLFQGLFQLMMEIARFVISLAPFGIFGLIAKTVGEAGLEPFKNLFLYFITVVIGLFIHACITLPLIQYLIGRRNPLILVRNMFSALITAFSTSSSSATLPVTLEKIEKEEGVSNSVASFVLPLGATVNMDGTALYECVAAIFLAQAYGITLSFPQQLIVVFTALLSSIGAAGIPMAGLVMLAIILKAVGLPLEGVGMIIAVDRFLDMMRTTTNVWSDITGAVVISRLERTNKM